MIFEVSRKKSENKEFDEAMKMLETAINLRSPAEDEKDKDVFDVHYFTNNRIKFISFISRRILTWSSPAVSSRSLVWKERSQIKPFLTILYCYNSYKLAARKVILVSYT